MLKRKILLLWVTGLMTACGLSVTPEQQTKWEEDRISHQNAKQEWDESRYNWNNIKGKTIHTVNIGPYHQITLVFKDGTKLEIEAYKYYMSIRN